MSFPHSKTYGHGVACKCEICECGRHKCTVHAPAASHYDPNDLNTHYQSSFQPHSVHGVPTRDMNAPKPTLSVTNVPFNAASTHQADFVHWNAKPADSARPKIFMTDVTGKAIGDPEDRNFGTEHRKQYDFKGLQKRESYAAPTRETIHLPFEGRTTTAEDFKPWKGVKPATPFTGDMKRHTQPGDDRDFRSEAHTQFVSHQTKPATPYKPNARTRQQMPFQADTTQRADFKQWNTKPATPQGPASRRVDTGPEDRDFRSVTAVEYTPKSIDRPKNFAPPPMHTLPLPFNAASTNQADFVPWNSRPADSAKPKIFMTDVTGKAIGDPEDRNFGTEHRKQYEFKGTQKRDSYAPPTRETVRLPFEGRTTTTEDFKPWKGVKPATPFTGDMKRHTQPGDDRDFRSEAHTQFVPHQTKPATPYKPNARTRRQMPFQADTTQRADFKRWTLDICPAQNLPPSSSIASDGHQLYSKVLNDGWRASDMNATQTASGAAKATAVAMLR